MDYSKVFQKVDAKTWKGETDNFVLSIKCNGHCGYWMVLTGRASAPRYGKHFKALSLWIAQFEASVRAAGQGVSEASLGDRPRFRPIALSKIAEKGSTVEYID